MSGKVSSNMRALNADNIKIQCNKNQKQKT